MGPLDYVKDLEGLTPDKIAAKLLAEGTGGIREDPCSCPIANHIKKQLPYEYPDVSVTPRHLFVEEESTVTPDNVSAFIKAFDAGDYPDLCFLEDA